MILRVSTPAAGRRPAVLVAAVLAALLGLTACTGSGGGGQTAQGETAPPGQSAKVALEPAEGAGDIAPRDPVSVTVSDGTIAEIALTNPEGEQVEGELSEDRSSWTIGEPLGYGKTYTWSGSAEGTDGTTVPIEGTFTTVTPSATSGVKSNVGDDNTYGVAMPVSLTFDAPVEDRAAVEKALHVETDPEIEGSWAWLDQGRAVHWRPKEYWRPHTEVSVRAELYGVHLGGGVYGDNDLTVDFSIGREQIVRADTQEHRMAVYRDGEQVGDYPASFGLESDPGRVTRSGIHVVMSKHPTYFMNNPGYGYEDFEVQWAVRISNNGEFTHSAPWSVADQGNRNVSHGCINLAPADAKAYFDSALQGDPVEITGSSEPLQPRDGLYHDWIYSWEEWRSMSALDG
ncbi:L,D-transpeptidase [Saccharomonospora piscinae]|uniref:L,D-transpeptidase n=1 Tax=Saccharomonospora piscinae TaxID=687388 RepID=UPI0006886FE6|nr:Ig-like domain-containing protein [Saccharomonospora piscinae]